MEKVLVANRGEIALRIFRTCRELGLRNVAVATPDDRSALYTRSADQTVEIGSYLHSEDHIRAAKRVRADAIQAVGEALHGDGPYAASVRPLTNPACVR